jgi:hypothetical protein
MWLISVSQLPGSNDLTVYSKTGKILICRGSDIFLPDFF